MKEKILNHSKIIISGTESKNMRSSSIHSSNISLISETTHSGELIGWSYQRTKDGKLHSMTKDFEWRQLYEERYVNDKVEVELIEFKEEIENRYKHSKCKNYTFPRIKSKKKINTADNNVNLNINKSQIQTEDTENAILNKHIAFEYKKNEVENNKWNHGSYESNIIYEQPSLPK